MVLKFGCGWNHLFPGDSVKCQCPGPFLYILNWGLWWDPGIRIFEVPQDWHGHTAFLWSRVSLRVISRCSLWKLHFHQHTYTCAPLKHGSELKSTQKLRDKEKGVGYYDLFCAMGRSLDLLLGTEGNHGWTIRNAQVHVLERIKLTNSRCSSVARWWV